MKIDLKNNLPYKKARRQYETIILLTNANKAHKQGQMKERLSKVEDAMHKHNEPENQSNQTMQHILDKIKAAQDKFQRDVIQLSDLKAETK